MNQARRGYVPDDDRWFSTESQPVLCTASRHIQYLINEGYDLKKSTEFVGNHFLLSSRQRMALMRCLCTDHDLSLRKAKEYDSSDISGKDVVLDGLNQIITLETYLQRGTLLHGRDGCIRDLAGLRGSYHLIPETEKAVEMILKHLSSLHPHSITFLFDRQVSNSGRLKTLAEKTAASLNIPVTLFLSSETDTCLKHLSCIVTTDSIILNECIHWYNLLEHLIPEEAVAFHL